MTHPDIWDDMVSRLIEAAKKFTAAGDMDAGYCFTEEDSEDYIKLRIIVDEFK